MDAANISKQDVGRWDELFVRDLDHQYVSGALVERATALIGDIAREAEARGFSVETPSTRLFAEARRHKWAWPHIVVAAHDGRLLSFHISERSRSDVEAKPRTLADRPSADGTPTWQAQRSTRFAPTGVLMVRVDSDIDHYRLKTGKDSTNTTIEDRLPNLFDAIVGEMVRCDEVSRRIRGQRERERTLKAQCRTERLYEALCDEVERHERLRAQRDYLDQVERRLDDAETDAPTSTPTGAEGRRDAGNGVSAKDVRLAIAAMRRYIDACDPLTGGGTDWTSQPEPTEAELFEYAHRADPSAHPRTATVLPTSAPPRYASGRTTPHRRPTASGRNGFFD